MDDHVTARWAEEAPRPAVGKFPLWAGDAPASDSAARAIVATVLPTGDSSGAPGACTSLGELAAQRRRVAPPPLPKSASQAPPPPLRAPLVAPPIAEPPIVEPEHIDQAGGPAASAPAESSAPATAAAEERGQQLPCWLTSLVLHLCLVIALNSYVVYAGGRYYGGGRAKVAAPGITARVASGGPEMVLEGGPAPIDAVPGSLDILPPEVDLVRPPHLDAAPAGTTQADKSAIELAMPAPPAAGALANADGPHSAPPAIAYFEPSDVELPAELPKRHSAPGGSPNHSGTTTRSVPPIDQVPGPSADGGAEPKVEELVKDAIVNQFIEYDLGRLRGAEATRARSNFDALRPDSIPAVVRGLNRAARITGTCPVMVLSQKLEEMLNHTNDPAMIRYAFENLGRDVPASAAHYSRIANLRQRLLGRQQEQVTGSLEQKGIVADEILLRRMAPLFSAGADRLQKSLGDPNAVIRQVAAMQVQERQTEFSDVERRRLARALVRLLRDPKPEPAAAAHAALVKLAEGDDYGPGAGASASEVTAAMREWNRAFTAEGDVPDERVAKGLLALARSLEHRGRKEAAAQRYRDICERFPDCPAAQEAQQQLDSLENRPQ